jgi:GTP diphosphokinase / guanosine-3',5'-bis(diphosphate) 3'-diphosphatase
MMTTRQLTLFRKAENRDTFFSRVRRFILPYHEGALLVAKAYQTAKDAHRGQKRKRGERYFEHCRCVALLVIELCDILDAEVVAAALLHDIVEDVPNWDSMKVESEFNPRVAGLVMALTMPEEKLANRQQRLAKYHEQLFAAPKEALAIKLCDRLHNLSTADSLAPTARVRMVDETEAVYLEHAKQYPKLHSQLCTVIDARRSAT